MVFDYEEVVDRRAHMSARDGANRTGDIVRRDQDVKGGREKPKPQELLPCMDSRLTLAINTLGPLKPVYATAWFRQIGVPSIDLRRRVGSRTQD